jgi:hypothetical protein
VRKEEIIYILSKASHPKAGQIGLAEQVGLAGQIGLAFPDIIVRSGVVRIKRGG